MKQTFLLLIFVAFSFCGTSQTWIPLFAGSSIQVDANSLKNSKINPNMLLKNGSKLNINAWNDYLKNFVMKFPAVKSDSIVDGLSRGFFEYDKVEKMIRFGPNSDQSSGYYNTSYIAFSGFIKGTEIFPFVKFNYTGTDWIYANRIKLVCDDETFEYDSLKFLTYGSTDFVSEYVLIPFNESMQELIPKIINSKETIIRFYGEPIYSDLVVSDEMKLDMRKFYKTIRALQ